MMAPVSVDRMTSKFQHYEENLFFAAIISLVTVLCVSATVAQPNAPENYSSSVTAIVAGMDEGIDFDTKTFVVIYNLMPQRVKDLCVASYKETAPCLDSHGQLIKIVSHLGGIWYRIPECL